MDGYTVGVHIAPERQESMKAAVLRRPGVLKGGEALSKR